MDEMLEVRSTPSSFAEGRSAVRPRGALGAPIAAAVLLVLFAFASWLLLSGGAPAPHSEPEPPLVGVATVGRSDVHVVLTGLGAVTPLATVTVKTQIDGQLQQVAFTEGQLVRKGDVLAQIDPRPYQVALAKDQGTLAHDQGLLDQARADNARYQRLNRQDSVSRQQVDDQIYLVRQYEGSVTSDQAGVDGDRLNLAYCRITSPIDGRVGIRLVDPGNYVQASDTSGLFVITQLRPISVLFTLPEDDVAEVQARSAAGPLAVEAFDRTNTRLVASGVLATTDNQIDATTGTVKMRAVFGNADGALFPQAFVNARLMVRTLKDAVTVPQAAIQSGPSGPFAYRLRSGGDVAVQPVRTGATEGVTVEVTDGLRPGDQVVIDGLDQLRDGARVKVGKAAAR